jgi:hypothetical protein
VALNPALRLAKSGTPCDSRISPKVAKCSRKLATAALLSNGEDSYKSCYQNELRAMPALATRLP